MAEDRGDSWSLSRTKWWFLISVCWMRQLRRSPSGKAWTNAKTIVWKLMFWTFWSHEILAVVIVRHRRSTPQHLAVNYRDNRRSRGISRDFMPAYTCEKMNSILTLDRYRCWFSTQSWLCTGLPLSHNESLFVSWIDYRWIHWFIASNLEQSVFL